MEYTVIINYNLEDLKRKLIQKGQRFSDFDKNRSGFYFILGVIEKAKYWNFRNERTFYTKLSWVVQEFPVSNNGTIYFGNYLNVLEEFQDYIREEFGIVPGNRIFWKRFWLVFFLTIWGSLFVTPFIGIPLTLILSIALGNRAENKARKEGLVIVNPTQLKNK